MDCPVCGEAAVYFPEFDASACLTCDRWLEAACGDAACNFCARRPPKPSEVLPESPNEYK